MFRTLAKLLRGPLARRELLERQVALQQALLHAQLAEERARLLAEAARATPLSPVCQGRKVYSQSDEDGILAEIFRRIGPGNRMFVEIGCGDGLENNTACLLLGGFSGVWIDASQKNVRRIEAALSPIDARRLVLRRAFVTRQNADALVAGTLGALAGAAPAAIDFLSIDIDGNDLAVFEAIACTRARVVCVEYNPKFPPPMKVALAYDKRHRWADDDYQGASLGAWLEPMASRGYRLVCCTLAGTNAFFVQQEFAGLFGDYPPEVLWRPARFDLCLLPSGHRASYGFLRDAVTMKRRGSPD